VASFNGVRGHQDNVSQEKRGRKESKKGGTKGRKEHKDAVTQSDGLIKTSALPATSCSGGAVREKDWGTVPGERKNENETRPDKNHSPTKSKVKDDKGQAASDERIEAVWLEASNKKYTEKGLDGQRYLD